MFSCHHLACLAVHPNRFILLRDEGRETDLESGGKFLVSSKKAGIFLIDIMKNAWEFCH